jgi:hypothetical protein
MIGQALDDIEKRVKSRRETKEVRWQEGGGVWRFFIYRRISNKNVARRWRFIACIHFLRPLIKRRNSDRNICEIPVLYKMHNFTIQLLANDL